MWGSMPFLCRVDSGLFLTYFEGDASVQQQLLWLREDGSLRHQQSLNDFTIRYAYTDGSVCKLVGVFITGESPWRRYGFTVHAYADNGSLLSIDTLFVETETRQTFFSESFITESDGVLYIGLMRGVLQSGSSTYYFRELRCESGVTTVCEPWPVSSISQSAHLFYLALSPVSQGNSVISFGIIHTDSAQLRYYGLDAFGQPIGPPHEYSLQNSQSLTGTSVAVYENTVYGCFTANNYTFPGNGGAFLIGFPADEILPITEPREVVPLSLSLQAYPNPFNASTRLQFSLARNARVTLDIVDITGRSVGTIASDWFAAGDHELIYEAAGLPSGMHFLRLHSENQTAVSKLLLIK